MGKEATFKLKGNTTDLEQKMAHISSKMKDMGQKMQQLGKSMSMYVTAPIVAMGTASVMAFGKQEAAERKLRAALQANGRQVQATFQRYNEFASEMQRLTTVGDETVLMMLQTAESMDLTGDAAERAVKNSIALEAAFGVNAESAMRMTAALEQGDATMLRRYIPALRDVEDNAKAVAMAQDILGRSFEIAKEDALTFTGSLQQMKNALGDAMEDVGGIIAQALQPLVGWLKQAAEAFQSLDDRTKKIIVVIAGLAAAIGPLLVILGMLVKTVIPALIAGGAAVSAAWLPLTAIILGVAAAVYLFNRRARQTKEIIDEIAGLSNQELIKSLQDIDNQLDKLKSTNSQQYELEQLLASKRAEWAKQEKDGKRQTLGQMQEERNLIEQISKAQQQNISHGKEIKDLQLKRSLVVKELAEREKAMNDETIDDYKEITELLKQQNGEYEKQLGILGKLQQQISDLNQQKLEALSSEELRRVYDDLRRVNTEIDNLYLSMRGGGEMQAITPMGAGSMGTENIIDHEKIIAHMREIAEKGKEMASELKESMLDLGGFIQGTLMESFDMLGTAIGAALTGKDFGMNNFLEMIADWGKRLGAIMVAAGLSLDAFKKLSISNPIALVAFGGALIAASAAVKAAVASTPSTGVNTSYGGGGGSGGELVGLRDLQQLTVLVSGELRAQGSELVTVISNENKRLGF